MNIHSVQRNFIKSVIFVRACMHYWTSTHKKEICKKFSSDNLYSLPLFLTLYPYQGMPRHHLSPWCDLILYQSSLHHKVINAEHPSGFQRISSLIIHMKKSWNYEKIALDLPARVILLPLKNLLLLNYYTKLHSKSCNNLYQHCRTLTKIHITSVKVLLSSIWYVSGEVLYNL